MYTYLQQNIFIYICSICMYICTYIDIFYMYINISTCGKVHYQRLVFNGIFNYFGNLVAWRTRIDGFIIQLITGGPHVETAFPFQLLS